MFVTKQLTFIVFFSSMEVNGCCQLFDYLHSSKYLLLCSAEEIIKYRFGTTWGWKFWVHYPFNEEFSKLKNTGFCSSFRRWLL